MQIFEKLPGALGQSFVSTRTVIRQHFGKKSKVGKAQINLTGVFSGINNPLRDHGNPWKHQGPHIWRQQNPRFSKWRPENLDICRRKFCWWLTWSTSLSGENRQHRHPEWAPKPQQGPAGRYRGQIAEKFLWRSQEEVSSRDGFTSADQEGRALQPEWAQEVQPPSVEVPEEHVYLHHPQGWPR